ncbi:hypothetical protein RV14_GL001423 [Enterococcus ratti]|uniref:GTP cyclohydrolase II domain-containing protein n=1 Tax=Enterococcus ratti TaxID=150033 RepID=A0A1L8WRC5_9ENTE|nr:hypothetical protein [Enterococcus ratti]OJG83545.1 hypothetical protein RV14_GL001423 [Enterococcus ratti]
MDPYQANVELGFSSDERNYQFTADILKPIGATIIRLMTNNPEKISDLQQVGIDAVERIPIETSPQKENQGYLKIKKISFIIIYQYKKRAKDDNF